MQDGTPPDQPSPLLAGGFLPGSTARLTQQCSLLDLNYLGIISPPVAESMTEITTRQLALNAQRWGGAFLS